VKSKFFGELKNLEVKMFNAFNAKKMKGDKLMGNIAKMMYTKSVGENCVLSLMLQMKQAGTLKKGDRISIPAGLHTLADGVATEVSDTHFLPTDNGMMIHEIISATQDSTMGAKGKSFCTKLTNIEASNPKKIEEE